MVSNTYLLIGGFKSFEIDTTFAGKELLVVGGASGMGLATAQPVLEQGGSAVLVGRHLDKASPAMRSLPPKGQADTITADITGTPGGCPAPASPQQAE